MNSSNCLIKHNNVRLDEFIKLLNNTQQCAFRRIHQTTIYYLIIYDNVRLDEFIKLLFLDNNGAFRFLVFNQLLWPNG